MKRAKGFVLGRGRLYRPARETVARAGTYAYKDRRDFKRNIRGLWITRLSAACRERGFTYSQFIHGLKAAQVELNRKTLSELAISDPPAFDAVVEVARKHFAATASR
jgi:large subunit ribosomal protein L20